ncbi:hypothetical protein M2302_005082 [Micromonospora sp. A200]|uniref:hypothetical protein n=1 Tax=Micromonospora sp. A200 TaxID=2940568 RepID=UPI0024771FC9|nr:hypothetical protein [Micromonospora sp. A200]MDH6464881.1 hypothetical protein [Micromonospora sp. A200]
MVEKVVNHIEDYQVHPVGKFRGCRLWDAQNGDKSEMSGARVRKAWLIAAVPVALYFVSLFTPFMAPYSRYPLYMVKCGGQPIVAWDFAASYTYKRPGDDGYGVDILTSDFFCTEAEAERAGFRRSELPGG